MSMIKYFYQLPVDEKGNIVVNPNTYLFQGGDILEKDKHYAGCKQHNNRKLHSLKICNNAEVMKKHGMYPVIHMSFKDIKQTSIRGIQIGLQNKILQLYKQKKYLQNTEMGKEYQQSYQQLIKLISLQNKSHTNDQIYLNLMRTMCRMLAKFHNTFCIVLIDSFDTPLNHFIYHLLENPDTFDGRYQRKLMIKRSRINLIFGNIFSFISTQPGIVKTLMITGIIPNPIKSQTDYNMLFLDTFKTQGTQFNKFYGFSHQQIQQMLSKIVSKENRQYDKKLKKLSDIIRERYSGYYCDGLKYYNPWSILNYLNSCIRQHKIKTADLKWAEKSDSVIMKGLLFDPLYNGNKMGIIIRLLTERRQNEQKYYRQSQTDYNLQIQRSSIEDNKAIKDIFQVDTFYLFIYLGYLTVRPIKYDSYRIHIQNNQIKIALMRVFKNWLTNKNLLFEDYHIDIKQTNTFIEIVHKFYHKISRKLELKNKGTFRELFNLVYSLSSNSTHKVSQQHPSGFGIIDNIFQPKDNQDSKSVVIHYYKYIDIRDCSCLNGSEWIVQASLQSILQMLTRCYMTKIATLKDQQIIVKLCCIAITNQENSANLCNFQVNLTLIEAQQINQNFHILAKGDKKLYTLDCNQFAKDICTQLSIKFDEIEKFVQRNLLKSTLEELNSFFNLKKVKIQQEQEEVKDNPSKRERQ